MASLSKKVLITGIDGFTGKHFESFLKKQGYDVFGTVLSQSKSDKHLICDIRDYSDVKNVISKVQPDYILHFVAISFVGENNSSLIYDINVIGTQNILDAVLFTQLNPEKIIIASSATIYGNQNHEVLDESMCPMPVNHYGISKLAMEHVVSTYFDKLNIIITRPFNYTGIGQAEHFLIPKIVKHYQDKAEIIELGNLHVAREFNSIDFVAKVYMELMQSNLNSETVNLCSSKAIKLLDVIDMMNDIASYEIEVRVNPAFVRENEIPILKGSDEKLCSLIGKIQMDDFKITLKQMYNTQSFECD